MISPFPGLKNASRYSRSSFFFSSSVKFDTFLIEVC